MTEAQKKKQGEIQGKSATSIFAQQEHHTKDPVSLLVHEHLKLKLISHGAVQVDDETFCAS